MRNMSRVDSGFKDFKMKKHYQFLHEKDEELKEKHNDNHKPDIQLTQTNNDNRNEL